MPSYEWGDEKLGRESTKPGNWYKGIIGYRDTIRIIANCDKVYKHGWTESGGFRSAMCSREDHGSCPYCTALKNDSTHQRVATFATTILHILRHSTAKGAKPEYIGEVKAWRFGDDKKNDLADVHDLHKKRGGLLGIDLSVKVSGNKPEDEQFQRLTIQASDPVLSALKAKYKKLIKEEKDAHMEEARLQYHPTVEMLREQLKIVQSDEVDDGEEIDLSDIDNLEIEDEDPVEAEEEEEEEEEEEKPKKKAKKKGKRKAKKKKPEPEPEEEEEEEEDDPIEGLFDD